MTGLAIDIVSDVVCPWCFIGKRRLDAALRELKNERPDVAPRIRWLPFFLNPDSPEVGEPYRPFLERKFGGPEKLAQLWAQIAAAGRTAGIEFAFERIETPTVTPAPLQDLGAIAFRQWTERDLTGELTYRLQTVRDGILTVEARGDGSGPLVLHLSDMTTNVVAWGTPITAGQRIDLPVSAGEVYQLRITGHSSTVEVTLANLLTLQGKRAFIQAAPEVAEVTLTAGWPLTVNVAGLRYQFDRNQVAQVEVRSGAGTHVRLTGGPAKDISVPPRRVNEIVQGKRSITADTALRLARYFGLIGTILAQSSGTLRSRCSKRQAGRTIGEGSENSQAEECLIVCKWMTILRRAQNRTCLSQHCRLYSVG